MNNQDKGSGFCRFRLPEIKKVAFMLSVSDFRKSWFGDFGSVNEWLVFGKRQRGDEQEKEEPDYSHE